MWWDRAGFYHRCDESGIDTLALLVSAAACRRQPYQAVAAESSLQVHIAVTARRLYGQSEAACSDRVTVCLQEPLGARSVVDDSTGNLLTVHPGLGASGRVDPGGAGL